MSKRARADQAFALGQLRKGEPCCPFCKAMTITPNANGPEPESFLSRGVWKTTCERHFHLVYCGDDDRYFSVVYRAPEGVPTCPECKSDLDVTASALAPTPLAASLDARAECWKCGSELGVVKYEAYEIRDEGTLRI